MHQSTRRMFRRILTGLVALCLTGSAAAGDFVTGVGMTDLAPDGKQPAVPASNIHIATEMDIRVYTTSDLIPVSAEFDQYAKLRFTGRRVVGGAVIISRNGEILAASAYGSRNAAGNKKVSLDTCFRVASVTKMVSAIGLIKLMSEKGISFDTPVSELVGYPVRNPAYPDRPITVRQLLTHTSGMANESGNYQVKWERLSTDNIIFMKKAPPGTRYLYSNMNGSLISTLIEALSGQSINTYMKENIFDPLGINAAYNAGLLPDTSDVAHLLNRDGSTCISSTWAISSVADYDDTCSPREHAGRSVGGLYISIKGLNRIISMLQMGGTLGGVKILDEEVVREMIACQVFEGSSVRVEGGYSLGLSMVTDEPGGTWYGHQGRYAGLSANTHFQPDTGLCVSVIANGYGLNSKNDVTTICRAFMEYAEELIR